MWKRLAAKTLAVSASTCGLAYGIAVYLRPQPLATDGYFIHSNGAQDSMPHSLWTPPSRAEMISRLKGQHPASAAPSDSQAATDAVTGGDPEPFDLLIIGGGATGAGCALDAVTRGLRVALVERDDFASGTSSRSTKLVHGGVRYLEKAFLEMDYEQYKLVSEALHERGVFLKIAPYLAYQLPIMLPIYTWWKIPYYWAGAKAYDALAKARGDHMPISYFLSKKRALEVFPMLKTDRLKGAIVYYDGAHNDSRMNTAVILTAVAHGATVANHVEVVELVKRKRQSARTLLGRPLGEEEICGAVVRDTLTGESWTVRAKGVVNATGPFTDGIRKMDEPQLAGIVSPSAGVHIILPNYYSPKHMGLIDPATSDGRVIFFLPWAGNVVAGTTDSPTNVTSNPVPTEKDINWILKEVENYLSPEIKVRRGDVLAAWSGIRPLVRDPAAKNTAALVRNHMIHVSDSGLLTIAGGKWTTYRAMAQETIDKAIEVFDLKPTGPCVTERTLLIGSHSWSKTMFIKLIQHFGLETEVAQHLADSYGDRAWGVASLASLTGKRWPVYGKRLSDHYPYIEAEIRFAVQREYACTAVDVIARRIRLAFLNAQAANQCLPRVIEIMSEELGWNQERSALEFQRAQKFLTTMGLPAGTKLFLGATTASHADRSSEEDFEVTDYTRHSFHPSELARYRYEFGKKDALGDGHIPRRDLDGVLKKLDMATDTRKIRKILEHIEVHEADTIEFNEFLEVLAAIKDSRTQSKFAKLLGSGQSQEQRPIQAERSGGGV